MPTTINKDIAQSEDDCDWNGGVDYSSADCLIHPGQAGLRFQNITVPQGNIIDEATLTIKAKKTAAPSQRSMRIQAFDEDDIDDFATTNPGTYSKTTTSIAELVTVNANYLEYTLDVTNIMQEVMDRGGWSSGNNLGFAIINGELWDRPEVGCYIAAYDHDTETEAHLEVKYIADGEVGDPLGTGFALHANNTQAEGITCDGTYLYVLDNGGDEVYKYALDGTYQSSFDTSGQTNNPKGIACDGTYLYIVDIGDAEVYKYALDGTYQSSFDTSSEAACSGIATDGNYIWTMSLANDKIYKYNMSGVYQNSFIDTSVENPTMKELETDGTYMWVLEDAAGGAGYDKERIYQYLISTGNFQKKWKLWVGAPQHQITGVAHNLGVFYVCDWSDNDIVTFLGYSAGTNLQINIGDVFKLIAEMKIVIDDGGKTWKVVAGAQENIGDAWKVVF